MVSDGYEHLRAILDAAHDQAAYGKGRDRHANELPFVQQPIMQITRDEGLGFPIGQARKKASEAHRMAKRCEYDRAEADLLGAIVYLAAAVLAIREASRQAAADEWESIKVGGTD